MNNAIVCDKLLLMKLCRLDYTSSGSEHRLLRIHMVSVLALEFKIEKKYDIVFLYSH